jgi:hypothetical protein
MKHHHALIGAAALASSTPPFHLQLTAAAFSPSRSLAPAGKRVATNIAVKNVFVAPRWSSSSSSLHSSLSNNNDDDDILAKISAELKELAECTSLVYGYLSRPENQVSVQDVVVACDAVDAAASSASSTALANKQLYLNRYLSLRQKSHEFGRYHLLVKLLKSDYNAYVKTAEFLSPSRIPRGELPNVQDVSYVPISTSDAAAPVTITGDDGKPLVPDCTLEELTYNDSPLDKLLLSIFRNLVATHTGGIQNDIPGIKGLLAQGRQFMTQELPPDVTYADHTKAQHTMVKNTLGGLMTPVLPPFYRVFMSGIVPKLGTDLNIQFGPWFYAPWLTSIVTPTFFGFLVGPSKPNRRSDGQRGGLVVEKCKFLQESGCKGLCLHQCKIPAQEFFKEELGLDLTVRPNFVTQECQWSFGEVPVCVEEDESFPKGCLVGCDSRKVIAGRKSAEILCM